jgi:hypothetical protein
LFKAYHIAVSDKKLVEVMGASMHLKAAYFFSVASFIQARLVQFFGNFENGHWFVLLLKQRNYGVVKGHCKVVYFSVRAMQDEKKVLLFLRKQSMKEGLKVRKYLIRNSKNVGRWCFVLKGYLLNDSCSLYCSFVLAMPKAFGTKTICPNDGSQTALNGYFSLEEILFEDLRICFKGFWEHLINYGHEVVIFLLFRQKD